VPLTQSLYVSGAVASTEHVLIDVGTNYYVEVCALQLERRRLSSTFTSVVLAQRPPHYPLLTVAPQMTADGGQEYCKRKVDKLRANINDLQEVRLWGRWLGFL
jgi:hypothetical protein